jgi:hypothetical protein
MFGSYWHQLIAVIGLALLASSGQAQERENEPQGADKEQQESAKPFAIPVEVVESQETTKARKRTEQQSDDREYADLVAQQGMDAATRRMAELAVWQTLFIFLGTCALIYTLFLTRSANRAAWKAVEATERMGQAQVRAYLSCIKFSLHLSDNGDFANTSVKLRNYGQSPAPEAQAILRVKFVVEGETPDIVRWFEMNFHSIQPEEEPFHEMAFSTRKADSESDDFSQAVQAHVDFIIYWTDVFGTEKFEVRNFVIMRSLQKSMGFSEANDMTHNLRESYRFDLMPYFQARRDKHRNDYGNPDKRAAHQKPLQEFS